VITINANLFRAAYQSVSTKEIRYYLNGVFVEPHKSGKGVTMTATDGHTLLHIYDADGAFGAGDKPCIVQLPADMVRKCKPSRGTSTPIMQIDTVAEIATLYSWNATVAEFSVVDADEIQRAKKCVVDGTFPDWRCVVPSVDMLKLGTDAFSGQLLSRMANVGDILADIKGGCPLKILTSKVGGPCIVRFCSDTADAVGFGVVMPMRATDVYGDDGRPSFF
jgi:hypothetical protein